MKRNLVLLLIIIAFSWACNFNREAENNLGYKIIETTRMVEDSANYSIKLDYPVFVADDEKLNVALEMLNQDIRSFLDTAANYYWGMSADSVMKFKDETGAFGKYELINDYYILDTTPEFISIKMSTYSYALGAHGFTALHTYNIELKEGRFLEFVDILDLSTPENEAALNGLLKAHFENESDCFNENPTADSTFRLFGFEEDFMLFFYETYELGPYYCGEAYVRVPLEELKSAGIWKAVCNP